MTKKRISVQEDQLVLMLKNREQRAYTILYDNYSGALFGVISKIVKDEEIAADVMQDAFIKIWKNIEGYSPGKGSLFTWMLNVCRNTAIDKVRSQDFQQSQQSQDIENYGGVADTANPIEASIDYIGLRKVVDSLRPEYKKLVDLIYFQGYTQAEVADEYDIPLGTVKTRIKAALTQLRGILGISMALLLYYLEEYGI